MPDFKKDEIRKNLLLSSSPSWSTFVNRRLDHLKTLILLSSLLIVVILSACSTPAGNDGHELAPEMLPKEDLGKEVATQKRISTYFHDKVIPKLRGCWGSLQGEGRVTMDYDFVRRNSEWAFQKATLFHSTLPDEQNDTALRCMQEALKDTSFVLEDLPVELIPPEKTKQSDNARQSENAKQLLVSWTWPVPISPDYEEQYKALLQSSGGGGGWGGCDGLGTAAKCWRCRYNSTRPSSSCCIKVCVGYTNCSYAYGDGKVIGCFNDPPTQCVSGGTGGLSSGVIMY